MCASHAARVNQFVVSPRRVDEVPASFYFLCLIENRCAGTRVLIRLPKVLVLLATLLLAVLAVGGGATSAAAHGNHSHQVTTSGPDLTPQVDALQQLATEQVAVANDAMGPALPDRDDKSDCCCGSFVCHAGVTLSIDFSFPYPTGARVIPEPSSGQPQRNLSGLERPPRTTYIA
jgi:hypothetical protein